MFIPCFNDRRHDFGLRELLRVVGQVGQAVQPNEVVLAQTKKPVLRCPRKQMTVRWRYMSRHWTEEKPSRTVFIAVHSLILFLSELRGAIRRTPVVDLHRIRFRITVAVAVDASARL